MIIVFNYLKDRFLPKTPINGGSKGYATSEMESETVIKKSLSHTNFST